MEYLLIVRLMTVEIIIPDRFHRWKLRINSFSCPARGFDVLCTDVQFIHVVSKCRNAVRNAGQNTEDGMLDGNGNINLAVIPHGVLLLPHGA